jgi:hypothetical protein
VINHLASKAEVFVALPLFLYLFCIQKWLLSALQGTTAIFRRDDKKLTEQ